MSDTDLQNYYDELAEHRERAALFFENVRIHAEVLIKCLIIADDFGAKYHALEARKNLGLAYNIIQNTLYRNSGSNA